MSSDSGSKMPTVVVGEDDDDVDLDTMLDEALLDFNTRKNDRHGSSAAASNQIDTDEDTPPNFIRGASTASVASSATHGLGLDGGGAGSVAGSVHLRTPPNSFVDPTAFKQAFEKHHRDMRRQFEGSSEAGSAPSEEGSMKSLQQALKMMQQAEKKTADSSSKAPTTEEEFDKMFESLRLGPAGSNSLHDDNLLPMMETMMQTLLSKNLLYPAIKDLAEKFPDWLADNRLKLSDAEFEKYNKQFEIAKQICHEFERDISDGDGEAKKRQFQRVMSLMQDMQSQGNPPKEIVGGSGGADGAFMPEFDAHGNPVLPPEMTDQCKVS